jgi:hypothetical protein
MKKLNIILVALLIIPFLTVLGQVVNVSSENVSSGNNVVNSVSTSALKFTVSNAYPNPFNPSTNIDIVLPKESKLKVAIYNLIGQEVKTVVNNKYQAGNYTFEVNMNEFESGVYFCKVISDGAGVMNSKIKKITLIK